MTRDWTNAGPWALPTASGEYVVHLSPTGAGLDLRYWGPHPGSWPADRVEQTNVLTDADVAPSEYAALGTRHVQRAELVADVSGGGQAGVFLELDDVEHDVRTTPDRTERHELRVLLRDATGTLAVTEVISTDTAHDAVVKHVEVENVSADRTVRLERVFSGAFDVPVGPGADVTLLAGAWAEEFGRYRAGLPVGELSIGSRNGLTGHQYAPSVVVQALGSDSAAAGFAASLSWSGSWRMSVEAVPTRGRVRVSGGIDDESAVVTLAPGERFVTPEIVGIDAPGGLADATRRRHAYQQRTVLRSTGPEHRPVVYNSWYATGWNVRVEHQRQLADVAHALGAECFVVDDGWFAGRDDDRRGIGDWWPDPVKFPDGLGPLIEAVVPRMRFGLWVEPECVSADSDLFRAHPDWIYRAEGRPLLTVRHQHVLDLGRPEVLAHIEQLLRNLLQDRRITFLKWDMNRPVTDGGRAGDPYGRQWSVQHAQGYYRLLRMVRQDFPHVTVESCASGAGRLDDAVLALSDVTWASDQTAPRARLEIQRGFLTVYPAAAMTSWVTDWADHGRPGCSFEFRFVVAMAGALGIGSDLLRWDGATRARAAELVALYKRIRPTVHTGSVALQGNPANGPHAVVFTARDAAQVVVLAYGHPSAPGPLTVPVPGLPARAHYRVSLPSGAANGIVRPRGLFGRRRPGDPADETVLTARDLATGIDVRWDLAPDADVVVLDRVSGG